MLVGQGFEQIAMVAENTTNPAIITDCDSRIMWVNKGFTRVTGYSLDEVVGKVPGNFLQCEETNPETIAEIRAAIRAARGFAGEILNRGKSGNRYWLELDIQPFFDAQGSHAGFISIQSDITVRKEAEASLRGAEEFLDSILGALHAGIVVLDDRGVIQHVNRSWRSFLVAKKIDGQLLTLGCSYLSSLEQLSGSDSQALKTVREGIHDVLTAEVCEFSIELELQNLQTPLWIELTVTPIVREGLTQLVVAHADITQRKLGEIKLARSEHSLRVIYESSSDAILLLTTAGEVLECNARAMQLLTGGGNSKLVGRSLAHFSPRLQPDGLPSTAFARHLQLAIATGSHRFEWMFRSSAGYQFPSELRLTVLSDQEQEVLQCTVRDISERKKSELLLRALKKDLEARTAAEKTLRETTGYLDAYRKIVDHHAIVAETDTAGTIIAVNDAFCKISGYSREELLGRNHRILNSGHHDKAMWTQMYKTVANGGHWHGEICNRAKDGSLYWVDTTIAPLYNDLGKVRGYFSIRADITSLKAARVAAEAASRTKSEFLANMSHEIRTPMTAILGYTDLLADYLQDVASTHHTREYVETIKRNGDHLLSIINDILDISKIEADKMRVEKIDVSPTELLHDVMTLMQVKARAKGIQLESSPSPTIPAMIQTDPTRLRQILVNLIGNAIKFTELGSVRVEVRPTLNEPNKIYFDIHDTGIGLSEQHLSVLFQAFEQADGSMTRKFGGTGLGLLISKRLAVMLGGDISVTSKLGKGSTFSVSIDVGATRSHATRSHETREAPQPSALSTFGFRVVDEVTSPIALGFPKGLVTSSTTMNPKIESGQSSRVVKQESQEGEHLRTAQQPASELSPQTQLSGLRILLAEDGPDNQRLIMFLLRKAGAEVRLAENGKLAVEMLTEDKTVFGPLLDPLPVDLILMDMQMPVMDGYEATELLKSKLCTVPILALTAHAMEAELERCMVAGCACRLTKPIDRTVLIGTCAEWGRKTIPLSFARESR